MTVTIDPSEVRGRAAVRRSLPVRALTVGAAGSVGLLAFTYGAFSFFSGLADNRVRAPRPAAVAAASMPDLKDGLPALAPDSGPAPKQTVLNLPKPPADEPAPLADAKPAEVAQTPLRTEAAAPAIAEPSRSAEATGSVGHPPAKLAKAAPAIENAATVSASAKQQAAVIGPAKLASPLGPAKAETVRAKPVETRTAAAPPVASAEAESAASKHAEAKPAKAKVAKAPVARTATAGDPAPAAPAPASSAKEDDDSDGLGSKLQSGMKALGGMFGGDE